jgi:O-antigen/teichoic acid export membrane protein
MITLAKSSVIALILQFAGVTLAYLVQVFLARWMGKVEYGIYEYIITWSLLLAVPASLGLPRAVVRFINEYRVKQEWGLLRGLVLGSWQLTIGMGLCLGCLGTGIIFLINHYYHLSHVPVLLIGIWLVPLQGLVLLQEDLARGVENIILAYTPTKVIWPILVLLGGFLLWHDRHSLGSVSMTEIALGTLLGAIALQACFIWFKVDGEVIPTDPIYIPRVWLKVSLPLLLYRAFRELLVQTDILMLGSFVGAAAVGIYSPASKTALWVSFVLQAINIVVAPTFAVLHTQDNRTELQKVIATVTVWIFWSSIAIGLILIIFAKPFLAMFGPDFVEAHWALRILVIGQLINALSGSVGNLLSMTGYQNQLMVVSACIALMNLGLNAIAIPIWGVVGAALTTAVTLSLWNIWLVVIVIRNLGVNPTVFASILSKKHTASEVV